MYTTLDVSIVNAIFFAIMKSGLSKSNNYSGLFKTSMVSLFGIKPFPSPEIFDY